MVADEVGATRGEGAPGGDERAATEYRALYEAAVERALAAVADPDPAVRPLFAVTLARTSSETPEEAAPYRLDWQLGQRGIDEDTALNRLFASLFIDAAEGRVDAYALVTRTEMTHEATGEAHGALAIDLEHRAAPPVTIYVMIDAGDGAGGVPTAGRTIPTPGRRVVFVDEADGG